MPTYTYRCPIHGDFEEFHNINEVIKWCPKCGENVKKIIKGAPIVNFKGNGFYVNDSKEEGSDKTDE